jgi:hypothetical protein
MNLVDQFISGEWVSKTYKFAKPHQFGNYLADLAGDRHINYLLEFNLLFEELAKFMYWKDDDFQVWQGDLKSDPKTVIECLRAIKKSVKEGRQGIINEEDWIEM